MNILIVMPVDETQLYFQRRIEVFLDNLPKTTAFSVADCVDFLIRTKKAPNQEVGIVFALATVKHFIEQNTDKNIVVLGTCPKNYKFDLIISYNINDEMVNPIDYQLKKLQEKYFDTPILNNLYTPEDAEQVFIKVEPTCEFLKKVLEDDREIKRISNRSN